MKLEKLTNYELDRPLPKGRNKEVFGVMKDELGRFMKSWKNFLQKFIDT